MWTSGGSIWKSSNPTLIYPGGASSALISDSILGTRLCISVVLRKFRHARLYAIHLNMPSRPPLIECSPIDGLWMARPRAQLAPN